MGGAASKVCSPCFSGLVQAKRTRNVPVDQVGSLQEALNLDRPEEGSWQPSPKAAQTSAGAAWASPVPRASPNAAPDGAPEFDLVIADLDGDLPLRRQTSPVGGSKARHLRTKSKFEVEQLVASPGSLPRPMYPDEREAAIRQVVPTTTQEMLAKVPRQFLEAQTLEAQELRRKLVKGATVVFVNAGYPGKRFILERAAQLGVKSVVIDHPDSWSRHLVEEGIIAKFVAIDMSQSSEEVYKQARAAVKSLGEDGLTGAVDGVTTFVELAVPLASRLAEAFGLPGFRPASVDAARDKHKTRAALKAAGLPTPRNSLITSEAELSAAGAQVGFPAVLKPVSGAASLGVMKVNSMQELQACYREVITELSSLVVSSGALVKNDGSGNGVNASKVVDLTVLLEQYLDGDEVDIDIVMSDGKWWYAAVSDNGPTLEPWFNESYGLCPSLLPKDKQHALRDLAVSSVNALGFTMGIFHVELKYTSTGPQLIEVNARMGGGPIREVNRHVWGIDMVEETLFCALGVPARPYVPKNPITCVGYSFVNAQKTGKIRSTASMEAMRDREGVLSADPLVRAGQEVVGPDTGLPTWMCQLVVSKPDPQTALDYVLRLEREIVVDYD